MRKLQRALLLYPGSLTVAAHFVSSAGFFLLLEDAALLIQMTSLVLWIVYNSL